VTPHERGIVDAVARARRDGFEPKSVYLSPDYREALGLADDVAEIGGLPLKRAARRSMLYCKHGIGRAIAPTPAGAAIGFSSGELLYLVSLLKGWPTVPSKPIEGWLRVKGLVASRTRTGRHRGRAHQVEEPRLTGAGEVEAQRIWDALSRAERAELRAQAGRAGL
jgi:hypothetical protein